jgi:hypothetical protein
MFWQGGGKKRLRHQIERAMEPARSSVELPAVGQDDEQLLVIYYQREQEREERGMEVRQNSTREKKQ